MYFTGNRVSDKKGRIVPLLVSVVILAICQHELLAQTGATPNVEAEKISLWTTVQAGGVIGFLITLMSMIGLSLVIEHLLSIRQKILLPPQLAQQLERDLDAGDFEDARTIAENDGSFLGQVVGTGLGRRESMFGFYEMQTAMQEASERQISKLYRKLEYLTFIAATAPMLGLLGTVTGMIKSFNKIAQTQGTATPAELAEGISQALITTCMGLIVAIPAIFFVSLFRNRIDSCVAEAEMIVEKLMGRFRAISTTEKPAGG